MILYITFFIYVYDRIIIYTSSISRVINSDINDNNGIKFVSCETDGRKCSLILGNDERRELLTILLF